jgi:hypothetical protein
VVVVVVVVVVVGLVKYFVIWSFLLWGVVKSSPNPKTEGPPLVGCILATVDLDYY